MKPNEKSRKDFTGPEPPPKILRLVPRASDLNRPLADKNYLVQRSDNGLVIGYIGPSKAGTISFGPDGAGFMLTPEALREIVDLIALHGVELAG